MAVIWSVDITQVKNFMKIFRLDIQIYYTQHCLIPKLKIKVLLLGNIYPCDFNK